MKAVKFTKESRGFEYATEVKNIRKADRKMRDMKKSRKVMWNNFNDTHFSEIS